MTYCVPILPRSGLANRLFPWARCRVFAVESGARMIAPFWFQLKVGPLLRRESDWRTYGGLFRPDPQDVSGLSRMMLLARLPRVQEAAARGTRTSPSGSASLVEFAGVSNYFATLVPHGALLSAAFGRIVRPRWVGRARGFDAAPIGLHVRRGDFAQAATPADFQARGGVRTPISWFVSMLGLLRRELRGDVPAFVVSDGHAEELAPLLALPSVALVSTGSAVSDLLALSRARLIVGSGGSTFSAWASFLGNCPAVSIGGQSLTWYGLPESWGGFVGDCDAESLPNGLVDVASQLRERWVTRRVSVSTAATPAWSGGTNA